MSHPQPGAKGAGLKEKVGLFGGPALALWILVGTDLVPGNPLVTRAAAVAVWMAVWWITEAIPIPATALLPVALFPPLGVMSGSVVAGSYFNHVIFLFIGGFVMALAMERWNLHRRIALRIVLRVHAARGDPPNAIVFGSGEVRMADMMRAGTAMNLIGVVMITALMYLLGLRIFGIDPGTLPTWAYPP